MPRTENREFDGGMVFAVVVTHPGTFHAHVRDAHPEQWARSCEMTRRMNANPYIGILPRKVNGTIMRPGEDVGDCREPLLPFTRLLGIDPATGG
jgi:hypothetical protein